MENASKAIIIAGGILIGIITISIFYFMFGQIGQYVGIMEDDTSQEELLAFNQSFESYNKKLMYGTDVLSVLNKAIDNNSKYDVTPGDDSGYSVDIAIIFKSELQTITEYYKKTTTGYVKERTNREKTAFKAGQEYSLKNDYDRINNLLIQGSSWKDENSNIEYDNSKSAVYEYSSDGNSYTVTYYPAAEFKRKTFSCTSIEYSDSTGRICKMTFTQYE